MAERPLRTRARSPRLPQATTERSQQVRWWLVRLQRARHLRQDWAAQWEVARLARTFTGERARDGSELERVIINRFWPTIKAQLPGLLHRQPKYFVRPSGRSAAQVTHQLSAQAEALLEQLMRQDQHFVIESQLALLQAFWAIGILKVTYTPTLEPNPQAGQARWLLGPDGLPQRDPMTGLLVPLTDPQTGAVQIEPSHVVTDELYRWRWIEWYRMLLPDEGPNPLRWHWIGEEICVTLAEAQADTRFPLALREQLRASGPVRPEALEAQWRPETSLGGADADPRQQEVWYTECWDIAAKRHLIYAEGQAFSQSHFLLEEDYPDGIEDHPYALLLGFTPLTDPHPSPWPVPHVWNWLGLQEEYVLRRDQMMQAAKRSARKIYYDNTTFADEDEAVASLQSSRDMEGIKLTDILRPPVTLPDPSSPPEVARDLSVLEKDWRDVTGMPGERLGTPASPTATQAVLADRSAQLRETEMQSAVNLWLQRAGQKMWQLVRSTLTLAQWVTIRDWSEAEVQEYLRRQFGPQAAMLLQVPGAREVFIQRYGRERWLPTTREQLQWEAEVQLQPGSSRPRTLAEDRQQTLQFLALLGQAPQLLLSRRLVQLLSDLFELGDEPLVEELVALGQQLMRQGGMGGGRTGGASAGIPPPGAAPLVSRLQTMLTNGGGSAV